MKQNSAHTSDFVQCSNQTVLVHLLNEMVWRLVHRFWNAYSAPHKTLTLFCSLSLSLVSVPTLVGIVCALFPFCWMFHVLLSYICFLCSITGECCCLLQLLLCCRRCCCCWWWWCCCSIHICGKYKQKSLPLTLFSVLFHWNLSRALRWTSTHTSLTIIHCSSKCMRNETMDEKITFGTQQFYQNGKVSCNRYHLASNEVKCDKRQREKCDHVVENISFRFQSIFREDKSFLSFLQYLPSPFFSHNVCECDWKAKKFKLLSTHTMLVWSNGRTWKFAVKMFSFQFLFTFHVNMLAGFCLITFGLVVVSTAIIIKCVLFARFRCPFNAKISHVFKYFLLCVWHQLAFHRTRESFCRIYIFPN